VTKTGSWAKGGGLAKKSDLKATSTPRVGARVLEETSDAGFTVWLRKKRAEPKKGRVKKVSHNTESRSCLSGRKKPWKNQMRVDLAQRRLEKKSKGRAAKVKKKKLGGKKEEDSHTAGAWGGPKNGNGWLNNPRGPERQKNTKGVGRKDAGGRPHTWWSGARRQKWPGTKKGRGD